MVLDYKARLEKLQVGLWTAHLICVSVLWKDYRLSHDTLHTHVFSHSPSGGIYLTAMTYPIITKEKGMDHTSMPSDA